MVYSKLFLIIISCFSLFTSCSDDNTLEMNEIDGFSLLEKINGHWIGSNETVFGNYDWFCFDFRPISPSHTHSIYEGATKSNIISSLFLAELDGELKVMARNGGWLGNQYRATYFVLDEYTENDQSQSYRLVDAVGGVNRAYMTFRFENGQLFFDAYKDNSGMLDAPIKHMSFVGTNRNPDFSQKAINEFNFPQAIAEVDFTGAFDELIDPDSALFLEESLDPFPRSEHQYLSELNIQINRNTITNNQPLLYYLSKEPILSENGVIDFDNLDNRLIRTIDIQANENEYSTTYLHPDTYYITLFLDSDGNFYPSSGDAYGISEAVIVEPEQLISTNVIIDNIVP